MLNSKAFLFYTFFALLLAVHFIFPSPALSEHPLLKKFIIAYNLRVLEKSLLDGSYRGEEGILRIRPEIGKSLGMTIFIDKDYLDATMLFKEADISLEKAEKAMASQKKLKSPGEHYREIADHFLLHKNTLESARKKVMAYRSRLNSNVDDRQNDALGVKVMDRLLKESLKRTNNQLRDALGYFYNLCQGVNVRNSTLTPENVSFVNEVFYQFSKQASKETLNLFDLDQDNKHENKSLSFNWENVVGKKGSQYVPLLEVISNKLDDEIYTVDPLLFLALMRRESNFDAHAISPVGAVGLTQIMPKTGKGLGMKNIYLPEYFNKAVSLAVRERKTRGEAMAVLSQINEANKMPYAKRARELMQKSLTLGEEKMSLFMRYREELLRERADDRLRPSQAMEYGLRYFAGLMKQQRGDISLALASYNAGPYSVEKYKGIPPYAETVFFRNWVLRYYRDYLVKAQETP
ncbi:MAG: lytic transglycosylase domain-containing protein [Desulfatiglandales bacterium]